MASLDPALPAMFWRTLATRLIPVLRELLALYHNAIFEVHDPLHDYIHFTQDHSRTKYVFIDVVRDRVRILI